MPALTDRTAMTLKTGFSLVEIIVVACLFGKTASDVGHIRDFMEIQAQTLINTVKRVDNLSERVATLEAYSGINRRDGQRRTEP